MAAKQLKKPEEATAVAAEDRAPSSLSSISDAGWKKLLEMRAANSQSKEEKQRQREAAGRRWQVMREEALARGRREFHKQREVAGGERAEAKSKPAPEFNLDDELFAASDWFLQPFGFEREDF